MSVDFLDKQSLELIEAIKAAGHTVYTLDGEWVFSDPVAIQAIVNAFVQPKPVLTMRQYRYALAYTGMEEIIDLSLTTLKLTNRPLYAQLKNNIYNPISIKWETITPAILSLSAILPLLQQNPRINEANCEVLWNVATSIT
jgi:hypothetical protein